MSFTITIDVFCDECSQWTHGDQGNGGARHKKRSFEMAFNQGWLKIAGKHLCPACVKKKLESV